MTKMKCMIQTGLITADAGVDFIKIYELVSPEVFDALAEAAAGRGRGQGLLRRAGQDLLERRPRPLARRALRERHNSGQYRRAIVAGVDRPRLRGDGADCCLRLFHQGALQNGDPVTSR